MRGLVALRLRPTPRELSLLGLEVLPGPRGVLLVDGEVGQRGTIGVGRYRFR